MLVMQKFVQGLCVCALGACFYMALATPATSADRFSTLTDGTFEKQLTPVPVETVADNTKLLEEALKAYASLPFSIGERMRFVITWVGVKAGYAEVMVRRPVVWKDTWAHRVTGEVKNADWYAWLLTLHDAVECIFDNSSEMLPLRFYINQHEPIGFKQTKILDFFSGEGKVLQKQKRPKQKITEHEYPLGPNTKDALASLYYFRSVVKPGEGKNEFSFPIFTSEKNWQGRARLIKQETVNVEGLSYDTDVYYLITSFGHLMEQKGEIKMWVTRDERRLPVLVEASLRFGYIQVALVEWEQGFVYGGKKQYPPIRATVKE